MLALAECKISARLLFLGVLTLHFGMCVERVRTARSGSHSRASTVLATPVSARSCKSVGAGASTSAPLQIRGCRCRCQHEAHIAPRARAQPAVLSLLGEAAHRSVGL